MAEAEWMEKISSKSICTWYYAFFIINFIIAGFALIGLIVGLFALPGPFWLRLLNSVTGIVGLSIAVVNGLFFYLMCDRSLLAEKKKDSDKKVHVAKTGETFYEIAQMEGIQLNALKSFNTTITEDKIKDGIILYLFNMPKDPIVPLPADKTKANNSSDKKASDITPKKNKFKIF
jgi:hypothetical protein